MKTTSSRCLCILLGIILTLGFIQIPTLLSGQVLASQSQVGPIIERNMIPAKSMESYLPSQYSDRLKQGHIPFALPGNNLNFMAQGTIGVLPMQMDLNGDGLTDFFFTSQSNEGPPYPSFDVFQYVLINTGNGFRMEYICRGRMNRTYGYQERWWGDCADYS
jgi:hypothetical protein